MVLLYVTKDFSLDIYFSSTKTGGTQYDPQGRTPQ